MAAQENDFNAREKIFEQNRPALMKMIRSVMTRPAWKFINWHFFQEQQANDSQSVRRTLLRLEASGEAFHISDRFQHL